MAARAHVIHDYVVATPRARARRQVRYADDPVVLPRSSVWSAGAGIIAAAVAIGAIVTASAFAGFRPETPVLSETPALPMMDNWQPDSLVGQANVTNLLAGPAHAVPSHAGAHNTARLDEGPMFSEPALSSPAPLSPAELSLEPPLPGTRTLPYPGPAESPSLPYPNPTTTPPDAIAPAESTPQTPSPALDPENPYRE